MEDEEIARTSRASKKLRALVDNMGHYLRGEGGGGLLEINLKHWNIERTLVMQTSFWETLASSSASHLSGQRSS